MAAAATELRSALITAVKADAGVQATAMGAAPRVYNRAPPQAAGESSPFPFLVVSTSSARPWDTTDERGAELDVEFRLIGEYEGDKQGEAILWALNQLLRDWAPQTFSTHRLVNLVCRFEDVRSEEDGKRYFGLQRWRAVTEEI